MSTSDRWIWCSKLIGFFIFFRKCRKQIFASMKFVAVNNNFPQCMCPAYLLTKTKNRNWKSNNLRGALPHYLLLLSHWMKLPFVFHPLCGHPYEHWPMAALWATTVASSTHDPSRVYRDQLNTSASAEWMRATAPVSSFQQVLEYHRWSAAAIRTAMGLLEPVAVLAGPVPIQVPPWQCFWDCEQRLPTVWHRILCSWCLVCQGWPPIRRLVDRHGLRIRIWFAIILWKIMVFVSENDRLEVNLVEISD